MLSAAKHLACRATAAGHRTTRPVRQQGARRLVRSFGLWPRNDISRVSLGAGKVEVRELLFRARAVLATRRDRVSVAG